MKTLIQNPDDPVWQCWLRHVAHVEFCVRHTFVPEDVAQIDRLQAEFLTSFEAVPQWQGVGYEKPKFHSPAHLGEMLDEFGPFRAYWSFPWEGFLKPMKRMFRMSNWKSAAYDTAVNWATKSVMHYRDPARCAWHQDAVFATSEFVPLASAASSPLARLLMALPHSTQPYAVRFLSHFMRGPDEVHLGDWLLLQRSGINLPVPTFLYQPTCTNPPVPTYLYQPTCTNPPVGVSQVGIVDHMVQATYAGQGGSSVRLLCTQCKDVRVDESGRMWAAPGASTKCLLVMLECMQVRVVARTLSSERDEFV